MTLPSDPESLKHHHYVKIFKNSITRILAYRHLDQIEHLRIIASQLHAPRFGSRDPSWVDRWPGGREAIEEDVAKIMDEFPQVDFVQVRYDHPDATIVYGRLRRLRFSKG